MLSIVLAAVLLLGWLVRAPLPEVEVAAVRQGHVSVRITTNGQVEPIESAEVRARLPGRIIFLPDPGARVEAGEVLFRIDAAPVSAELATAESSRLAARESLAAARRELERVSHRARTDRELFAQGGVTPERHAESQAELAAAAARVEFLTRDVPLQVEALELQIAELRSQLEAAEVRAAFSGTLYDTNVKLGESVGAGDLVLWFADLERLRVRTNIDQADLGAVAVGQVVQISSNAYPGRVWSARVSELIPRVVRKQARLVAEGLVNVEAPSQGLMPGMTVDVDIVVDSGPEVTLAPAGAVYTDAGGSYVLRVEDGRVFKTRVELGRTGESTIEISEGLRLRDQIVVGPQNGLVDGARVEVTRRDDG